MHVTILNKPLNRETESRINDFLFQHPNAPVFQSPAYYSFYYSIKDYQPYYFLLTDDSGDLRGIMLATLVAEGNPILSLLSRRCFIQGGPVVEENRPEYAAELLKALNASALSRSLIVQFRNARVWDEAMRKVFDAHGYVFHDHLNLILPLPTREETLKDQSESRRRQIRKGLESGARIGRAENLEEVREFYRILKELYRTKVRKPLPELSFFEAFFRQLVPAGKGILLLVWYQDVIIGGIVAGITPGRMIHEWYICGRDQEYPAQHPSVLATWAAMEYGIENGIPAFDFMGLGKPDQPYGVRDFKLRFGGEPVNFGRFGRKNARLLYAVAETAYGFLLRLRGGGKPAKGKTS
jgi:serine/alanine adding enzyme